jgi:hypothetical protein
MQKKNVCTKCQIEKPLNDFYKDTSMKSGRRGECKICAKEHQKEYRKNNKEKIREHCKEYRKNNKEKRDNYNKEYYQNNKEKIREHQKEYNKEYYQDNKEKRLEYYQNNKEKIREYYKNNKEKIREHRKKYQKEKYKTDVNHKIRCILRSRIRKAIKNNYKTSSSIELLGCSIQEVREHLESQFKEGMTWDNHSLDGWHIDHIKPCTSFDLSDPEQQKECFHYTNLQPLWAEENISKGAKIHEDQ